MAYTLSNIISKVQKRVQDTAYSTAEITDYINDAQRAPFNEYRFDAMRTRANFTVTIGQSDITNGSGLPTNYVEATSLRVTTAGKEQTLSFISEDDLEDLYPSYDTATNGDPLYAYFSDNTIKVYPAPSSAYTVRLRYYRKPDLLENNDDVPEIASEFEEMLVVGGAYRVLQAKHAYDEAGIMENKFNEELQKFFDKYLRAPASGPAIMKVNKIGVNYRNTSRRVDSIRRRP